MDRIEKALRNLSNKERQKLKGILARINKGNFQNLDLKKTERKN